MYMTVLADTYMHRAPHRRNSRALPTNYYCRDQQLKAPVQHLCVRKEATRQVQESKAKWQKAGDCANQAQLSAQELSQWLPCRFGSAKPETGAEATSLKGGAELDI